MYKTNLETDVKAPLELRATGPNQIMKLLKGF